MTTSLTATRDRMRPGLARIVVTIAGMSLLSNLIVYAAGRLAGVDFEVVSFIGNRHETVGVQAIVVMTLVPMVLGGLALLVTRRWARTAWQLLAWVGIGLGVITVPIFNEAELSTKLTLAVMHLTTSGLWFYAVRRLAKKQA